MDTCIPYDDLYNHCRAILDDWAWLTDLKQFILLRVLNKIKKYLDNILAQRQSCLPLELESYVW